MGTLLMLKEKNSGNEWIFNYDNVQVTAPLASGGCRLYMMFSYKEEESVYVDVCESREEITEILDEMFSDDDECGHGLNESDEFGNLGEPL